MDGFKGFLGENRDFVISFVIVSIICAISIWCFRDYHRNDDQYHDTDATMERIEKRIESVEHRLDGLSARIDNAQKTITDLGGRIDTSTGLAKEIGNGIDGVQGRLDSAIQRSGRIKNIIADIENANK